VKKENAIPLGCKKYEIETFNQKGVSWKEAFDFCLTNKSNMQLVSIETPEEQKCLENITSGKF
jgi:hypothetical protein